MTYQTGESDTTTAADVSRNFGYWQDKAINCPIVVTHHGRPRVVIISADHFATWTKRPHSNEPSSDAGLDFETRLAAVLDHTDDGFISLKADVDLTITTVNRVAEQYFGRLQGWLKNRGLLEAFPELLGSLLYSRVMRTLRSGISDNFETPSVLYPERRLRVRVFSYQEGAAILFTNISELALANRAIAAADAIQEAVDAAGGSYVELNVRGAVIDATPGFSQAFGLNIDNVRGIKFTDLFALSDRVSVQRELEEVFQVRQVRNRSARILSKYGGEIPVRLGIAPVMNGVSPESVICVMTNEIDATAFAGVAAM